MEETRRLLRATERGALSGTTGGVRDRAIVTMLLFTGLRIAELAALDRDDVGISAHKGVVTVRRGKGDRYRQVPLNAEARDTLDAWLDKQTRGPARQRRTGTVPLIEGTAAVRPSDSTCSRR